MSAPGRNVRGLQKIDVNATDASLANARLTQLHDNKAARAPRPAPPSAAPRGVTIPQEFNFSTSSRSKSAPSSTSTTESRRDSRRESARLSGGSSRSSVGSSVAPPPRPRVTSTPPAPRAPSSSSSGSVKRKADSIYEDVIEIVIPSKRQSTNAEPLAPAPLLSESQLSNSVDSGTQSTPDSQSAATQASVETRSTAVGTDTDNSAALLEEMTAHLKAAVEDAAVKHAALAATLKENESVREGPILDKAVWDGRVDNLDREVARLRLDLSAAQSHIAQLSMMNRLALADLAAATQPAPAALLEARLPPTPYLRGGFSSSTRHARAPHSNQENMPPVDRRILRVLYEEQPQQEVEQEQQNEQSAVHMDQDIHQEQDQDQENAIDGHEQAVQPPRVAESGTQTEPAASASPEPRASAERGRQRVRSLRFLVEVQRQQIDELKKRVEEAASRTADGDEAVQQATAQLRRENAELRSLLRDAQRETDDATARMETLRRGTEGIMTETLASMQELAEENARLRAAQSGA